MAWMDGDRSYQSRELLAAFQGSGRFEFVAAPANDRQVQQLLDSNGADLVIRVLPGFERDLDRGRNTSVQVLINGSNSNTASIVSSYASSIITNFASEVMLGTQSRSARPRAKFPHPFLARAAARYAQPCLVQSGPAAAAIILSRASW